MQDQDERPAVCLLARTGWGHSESYLATVRMALRQRGLDTFVTASPWEAFKARGPVLIMHVEQYKMRSHALILARALLGRRTAALVLRSREAIIGSMLVTRLKRLALHLERRLLMVSMMTIVPHALLPKGGRLFRSWIHDPQLWDVPFLGVAPADGPLAIRVRERAAGRPVVVALGMMAEYKGMHMLASLAKDAGFCRDYQLVIAGPQVVNTRGFFTGIDDSVIVEDRYITDQELYDLYGVASFVWAVYGPGYDQASGILSRAIQFGRTAMVREGSLSEAYAEFLDVAVVSVPWDDDPGGVADRLRHAPVNPPPRSIGAESSTDALVKALVG